MPTTRKKEHKARRSRILSHLGNVDVMLESNHYDLDASVDHNSNSHSNSRENEIRGFAGNGQS